MSRTPLFDRSHQAITFDAAKAKYNLKDNKHENSTLAVLTISAAGWEDLCHWSGKDWIYITTNSNKLC